MQYPLSDTAFFLTVSFNPKQFAKAEIDCFESGLRRHLRRYCWERFNNIKTETYIFASMVMIVKTCFDKATETFRRKVLESVI